MFIRNTYNQTQTIAYIRKYPHEEAYEKNSLKDREYDTIFDDNSLYVNEIHPYFCNCLGYVRKGDMLCFPSVKTIIDEHDSIFKIMEFLKKNGTIVRFDLEDITIDPEKEDPKTELIFNTIQTFYTFQLDKKLVKNKKEFKKVDSIDDIDIIIVSYFMHRQNREKELAEYIEKVAKKTGLSNEYVEKYINEVMNRNILMDKKSNKEKEFSFI